MKIPIKVAGAAFCLALTALGAPLAVAQDALSARVTVSNLALSASAQLPGGQPGFNAQQTAYYLDSYLFDYAGPNRSDRRDNTGTFPLHTELVDGVTRTSGSISHPIAGTWDLIAAIDPASSWGRADTTWASQSQITVTPHTILSLTGHVSISVDGGGGNAPFGSYGNLNIILTGGGDTAAWGTYLQAGNHLQNQANDFVVQLANPTDRPMVMPLDIRAQVEAGKAPPIPEPAHWAMLGAGLGLLGWRMRNRRAKP